MRLGSRVNLHLESRVNLCLGSRVDLLQGTYVNLHRAHMGASATKYISNMKIFTELDSLVARNPQMYFPV